MPDDRYEQLYDQAPFAILTIDAAGHIIACNTALTGLIARGSQELIGTPVLKWISPEDRDRARARFMEAVQGLMSEWQTVLRCGDGVQRRVGVRTLPMRTDSGSRVDVVLSERGVERPLRTADAAVFELLTNIPGVYSLVLDTDMRIRQARGMSRTHWCRDEDVVGREIVSLLEPVDFNARQMDALRGTLAAGEAWSGILRHVRVDGSAFPVHAYAMARLDPRTRAPVGSVMVGREAHEEIELRSQLASAQRLSPIGAVATSVARELSADLVAMRSRLEAEPPRIHDVLSSLTHLQRMTQSLLAFATDVEPERRDTALAPVAAEVVSALAPDISDAGATVEIAIPDDLPDLDVDARHVREILRQVVLNAVEAVAGADRRNVRIEAMRRGGSIAIRVRDTGAGMSDSVAARAFDPFFTTRAHRLGLGLAIARAMAAAHGGRVLAASDRDGTTVTIELPHEATGSQVAFRAAPLVFGQERTILLVDDDAAVRNLFRRVLEKVGYHTEEAWSGRSALAALAGGHTPDFLVTDLRMTGGNGYWLLRQIGRDYPELLRRTVIVTGDQSDTEVDRVSAETGCPVLRKPIDVRMLLEVLDALALHAQATRAR